MTACEHVFTAIPLYNDRVGIGAVVYVLLYFISALITFYWIWKQRTVEDIQRDEFEGRARKNYTIFPIFVPILIYSVASDILFGVVNLFFQISETSPNGIGISILYGTVYALQHFMLEGLAFALCQYGCGIGAAKNAALRSFGWACVTFLCIFLRYYDGATKLGYVVELCWQCCMGIYYYVIWLVPKETLFRRPAVIYYSKFWAIFRTVSIIGAILLDFGSNRLMIDVGMCTQVFVFYYLYIILKPFVVYYTLLADTVWWQGQQTRSPTMGITKKLSKSASKMLIYRCGRNDKGDKGDRAASNRNSQRKPFHEEFNPESSLTVAQELAHAGADHGSNAVVDSLQSKGAVKLLNSSYLKYNKKDKIGAGSFSNVYVGKFRSVQVAIKMLLTIDLTPEVIRRCGNEAQLLSRIQNRNVVCCLGVAVLPPSVCIVLEMCQFGSLSDVLRGVDAGGIKKMPLNLTLADRMFLALGCARGLEALHSFSPYLCHRDIKSMNFLVDSQLDVKIADLELGYNSKQDQQQGTGTGTDEDNGDDDDDDDVALRRILSHTTLPEFYSSAMISPWQPPEIFKGEEYSQASDVYSLALVLWEIFAAPYLRNKQQKGGDKGTPFWEYAKDDIKNEVIAGRRPLLPPGQDPLVIDLISRGWSNSPTQRPDAEEFCKVLAKCWRSVVHRHICETNFIVDMKIIKPAHEQQLVDRQRDANSKWKSGTRKAPTPTLLNALSVMQHEYRWAKLEQLGAFLITSPEPPFIILWATKKWTQLTGFVLNDVLGDDLSIIGGPKSDSRMLNQALGLTFCGETAHMMYTAYRRDGLHLDISLHSYPIFDDKSDLTIPDPLATFGPDLIPFTLSRSNSIDGTFYSLSPQPKPLPTLIEEDQQDEVKCAKVTNDAKDDRHSLLQVNIDDNTDAATGSMVDSLQAAPNSISDAIPSHLRALSPTVCTTSSSTVKTTMSQSAPASSTLNPIQRYKSPLVKSGSGAAVGDDIEAQIGHTGPLIARGNSYRGSLERYALGNSYNSSASNHRNISILSSILSGHDSSSMRSVGATDETKEPLLGSGEQGASFAPISHVDNQLDYILADLAGGQSTGPAFSGASTTKQLRSDPTTMQRLSLGLNPTMGQEFDEIEQRASYPSFRSSITSLQACKRVAYVAILFSDIKEGT